MFHRFEKSIDSVKVPDRFTYPFCYVPNELCVHAAGEVRRYLMTNSVLYQDALRGKMFGVLVVRNEDGEYGFLAAFSGLLAGFARTDYFVPPVFDLTDPDGFFKKEEAGISAINRRIDEVVGSCRFNSCMQRLYNSEYNAGRQLETEKEKLKFAKYMRDERRRAGVSEEEEKDMIRQSQFQKAEYRRLERRLKDEISAARQEVEKINREIEDMKSERKMRSAALQDKLFRSFVLLNAEGEKRNLVDVFNDCGIGVPPSGAGECAAPKLLQYAFLNRLHPVAMAEFWVGASPRSEVRTDGNFYPSCTSKCGPILRYMLRGLDVESDPIALEAGREHFPKIIYEDEALIVVDKPAGMLTVPGRVAAVSLYDFVLSVCHDVCGPAVVHRLDMATSGLVVFARNKEVHEDLQRQFAERQVEKHYIAIVEGQPVADEGIIDLPLCPDIDDRPRQMVNYEYGKPSVTRYKVIERTRSEARVMFTPLTGRTHQIRVHAASSMGLGCPVKGDAIYGKKAERLYLHAAYISFVHPLSGKRVEFESEPEF